MFVLHAKFVVEEGHEADYERWKVDQATIQLVAPGTGTDCTSSSPV